jgi:hypothetical protein
VADVVASDNDDRGAVVEGEPIDALTITLYTVKRLVFPSDEMTGRVVANEATFVFSMRVSEPITLASVEWCPRGGEGGGEGGRCRVSEVIIVADPFLR